MGSLGPLRSSLFQYRKRKRISLDGTVGGVQPNRYRAGLGSAFPGRANVRGGGVAPRDYMSFHPDAYEPHPGEVVSSDALYSPYRAEVAHRAPDELDAPAAGSLSDTDQAEHGGPAIDHDLAGWLMRRFVNELPHRPAPDAIPIDHDVMFEGSIGPTIGEPSGHPNDRPAINEIWDRVLNRPAYDSSRMTDAMFAQALQNAAHTGSAFESAPAESGMTNQGWFPTPADQIAAQDDGVSPDAMGEDSQDIDSLGMAADLIYEPDIHADVDPDEALDPGFPDADAFENGLDMPDVGPLEQIAEELAPPVPEPDPMMEEQLYEDELLMDPWMMPGMGPMPPGLGPMGPMM